MVIKNEPYPWGKDFRYGSFPEFDTTWEKLVTLLYCIVVIALTSMFGGSYYAPKQSTTTGTR